MVLQDRMVTSARPSWPCGPWLGPVVAVVSAGRVRVVVVVDAKMPEGPGLAVDAGLVDASVPPVIGRAEVGAAERTS